MLTGTAGLSFNPAAGAYDPAPSAAKASSPWALPPDLMQSLQGAVGGMNTALQAQNQIPSLMGALQQTQAQSQALDTSDYPTYPNPAGLGTQNGGAPSAPQYLADRGLTPYSLPGEASVRTR